RSIWFRDAAPSCVNRRAAAAGVVRSALSARCNRNLSPTRSSLFNIKGIAVRRKISRMSAAMSDFERGLETVISAIEKIRLRNEQPPRAALATIEKLRLVSPPDKAACLASLGDRVAIC